MPTETRGVPGSDYLKPLDLMGPVSVSFEYFDDAWVVRPLIARFGEIAARHPERIAVADGSRRLTYRQVHGAALDLARRIVAAVPPGRPVAVMLPNGALFPVAALGCFAARRSYVPIDLDYPSARNELILREAGAAAVVCEGERGLRTEFSSSALTHLDIGDSLRATIDLSPLASPNGGATAILYTSGSTGRPKGICNDESAILQRIAQYTNACHIHADDRFVLFSSPATIAGIRDTFAPLLNGASLFVAEPLRLGLRGTLNCLRDERITICYAVPALLRALLRAPGAGAAFRTVRIVRIGGDVAFSSDVALCRDVLPRSCHLLVGFGSTEAPTIFQWFVPPDWNSGDARLPCGYPVPGVDISIQRDADAPAEASTSGELIVTSRYVALGLWQDGRLEAGSFKDDARDPSRRTIQTGDLVRYREDGLVELIGRKDRQIKLRGLRVDPGEVEAVLRTCDGVVDAAILARRSEDQVAALIAYVVAPAAMASDAIEEALAKRLPRHMWPAEIHLVPTIPYLPGYKLDVAALVEMHRSDAALVRETPAAAVVDAGDDIPSDLRDAVSRAWRTVLGDSSAAQAVGWEKSGGDSLKLLQLWLEIEAALSVPVALDSFKPGITEHALAASISRQLASPDVLSRGDERAPVVYLMPGIQNDDFQLARFRAACGDAIRFVVIRYPSWRAMIDRRTGFDAAVASAVSQVLTTCHGDPVRLAGNSFGGFVAFEAARRIAACGHEIELLALIDTRRHAPPAAWKRALLPFAVRLAALVPSGRLRLRAVRLTPRRANSLYRRFVWYVRSRTLDFFVPAPIDVPTVLFTAFGTQEAGLADYGWRALCSRFELVAVKGTHLSIMDPPAVATLAARFVAIVTDAAQARRPRGESGLHSAERLHAGQ